MLSLRSNRQKPVPKTLSFGFQSRSLVTLEKHPQPPLLELSKAYIASLKSTLANSLQDNADLHAKLQKTKQDLKDARSLNLKLADYKEWRRKAELGYEVGYSEGAKDVIQKLQDRLTTELGVAMKCGLRLSYDQYDGVRFLLSHDIDGVTNRHVRFLVPTLPTQDAIRSWMYAEMEKKGLACSWAGANIDPGRLLKDMIAGPCVRDNDGNYHIQVMADGVKVFRNSMMTNVGLRAFDRGDFYNSMTGLRLMGIIEGKDDYCHMKNLMSELNVHILYEQNGPEKIGMSFWGGGDMVFTACVQGRDNGFASDGYNCNYCEVHNTKLHILAPSTVRTLNRQYHLSHEFDPTNPIAFDCPGCGKHFETKEDVAQEPVDRRIYADKHFGQNWHCPPLLHIEPARYIVCVLHLLLSCTKLIFKKGVLQMLESETQAVTLNARLKTLGICVPNQTKVSDRVASDQSRRVKFTGNECVKLLEAWDVVVNEIVCQAVRPAEWKCHADQTKMCGDALIALYNAIKTRCSTEWTAEQKRERIRQLAICFQDSIVSLAGDESVTYYVHAAVHHLPDQVVACPVDIVDGSGSGIEHLNSIVRTTFRHGSDQRRNAQISKHGKVSHNRAGQVLSRLHVSTGSRLPTLVARHRKRAHVRMTRLRMNGRVPKLLVKKETLPTPIMPAIVECGEQSNPQKSMDAAITDRGEVLANTKKRKRGDGQRNAKDIERAVKKATKAMKK